MSKRRPRAQVGDAIEHNSRANTSTFRNEDGITGLLEATSGKILFDDHPIERDPFAHKRHVGYVPEEPHPYVHLSGLEYLTMVGQLGDLPQRQTTERIDGLLHLLSLHQDRHVAISNYWELDPCAGRTKQSDSFQLA